MVFLLLIIMEHKCKSKETINYLNTVSAIGLNEHLKNCQLLRLQVMFGMKQLLLSILVYLKGRCCVFTQLE